MKRQFNILACRDVSKSEFSESEKQRAAQVAAGGRTLLLDQDENATNFSNSTSSSKRCLKLALQPLCQADLPELISAFEFAGPLRLGSMGMGIEELEGKVLEIDSDHLDLVRGILLLHPNQCRILESSIPDEFFLEDDSFII